MASGTRSGALETWGRTLALAAFLASVVIQLKVLYTPNLGGSSPFPYADKVVHITIFAMPVMLAVLAFGRLQLAAVIAAVHAPVSELIQRFFVQGRSGDIGDVVADLVGVGVAVLVILIVRRRAAADRAA